MEAMHSEWILPTQPPCRDTKTGVCPLPLMSIHPIGADDYPKPRGSVVSNGEHGMQQASRPTQAGAGYRRSLES